MAVADSSGLPVGVYTSSASPHEVTLVQATIDATITLRRPRRIIGDRAYDSDPLDTKLAEQDIELIAPHRRNRKRAKTQDGRPLRRYRRRWKIERLALPGLAWVMTRNDTSQLESTMNPLRAAFFTLRELQSYPSNSIKS